MVRWPLTFDHQNVISSSSNPSEHLCQVPSILSRCHKHSRHKSLEFKKKKFSKILNHTAYNHQCTPKTRLIGPVVFEIISEQGIGHAYTRQMLSVQWINSRFYTHFMFPLQIRYWVLFSFILCLYSTDCTQSNDFWTQMCLLHNLGYSYGLGPFNRKYDLIF